jgi:hypothetical protein
MTISMYLLTLLNVDSTQFEVSRDIVLFGLGLGTVFAVFNVVAQNAVDSRYVSSATSALQFVRQIGGVLGLAVLGSVVNQVLKDRIKTDVPQSALLQVPPALRDQVTNPEAFFSDRFQGAVNATIAALPSPAARAQALATFDTIRHGVQAALADSIHVAFEIGLVTLVLALVMSFFIKEIPLRRTSALQDRAAARTEAKAEAVGF